ncbi:unnamed protein product [Ixodes persulcatus]
MSGIEEPADAGMPLFKWSKGSGDIRTKFERKLYLAQENPEPVFDLSDCSLSDVPSGVFSKCRVFRKTTLLLHDNRLSSINGGGLLKDLGEIIVLDLHANKLSSLPDDFGLLKCLSVLDLGGNALKKLPGSFAMLLLLESLNLSENKFKDFPSPVVKLRRLQKLNVSRNAISKLPADFHELKCLQALTLDAEKYTFPPANVCEQSLNTIMQFLCDSAGVSFSPSSDFLDQSSDVMDAVKPATYPELEAEDQYKQFEERKDKRRLELLDMEARLKDTMASQATITEDTRKRKRQLLLEIAREQDVLEDAILNIQSKKDTEKQKLLSLLAHLEDHSASLIQQISNEVRSKNSEARARALEQERLEMEELFNCQQTETDIIRRREVLSSMAEVLQQEERQRLYRQERESMAKDIHEEEAVTDRLLQDAMSTKGKEQDKLIGRILDEEQYQRQAFTALQIKHDYTHCHIMQQIRLVEKELKRLTEAELKRRDLKVMSEMEALSRHRVELAYLLAQLLDDKDIREKELQSQIKDMEDRRQEEMIDFWLLQYQRLLDRKPEGVYAMENQLDPRISDILETANAEHYSTLFASKKVSWEDFTSMNQDDFRRLGIASEVVIQTLLMAVEHSVSEFRCKEMQPSAPSPEEESSKSAVASPTALPPPHDLRLWCSSECVVCFDVKTLLVFAPCGHVCCCFECSLDVSLCPLCRSNIESKLSLL